MWEGLLNWTNLGPAYWADLDKHHNYNHRLGSNGAGSSSNDWLWGEDSRDEVTASGIAHWARGPAMLCEAVCREVQTRLEWAERQRGDDGGRLLYLRQQDGVWVWDTEAQGKYEVLLAWFQRGM